jgi:predicted tellurium resistance membrane protein TerC
MEWISWVVDPNVWASLVTLTFLEIVLGIDNVIFISILYIYFAMAFATAVEMLNLRVRSKHHE